MAGRGDVNFQGCRNSYTQNFTHENINMDSGADVSRTSHAATTSAQNDSSLSTQNPFYKQFKARKFDSKKFEQKHLALILKKY